MSIMGVIEITGVTIRPFSGGDDKLKAFASIILNNAFIIKDLKIIEGNNGRFVAMPSRRGKDGVFRDVAHPLNQETRDYVEKSILAAYEEQAAAGFPHADTPDEHGEINLH
jgi:stage V sporulation protein G